MFCFFFIWWKRFKTKERLQYYSCLRTLIIFVQIYLPLYCIILLCTVWFFFDIVCICYFFGEFSDVWWHDLHLWWICWNWLSCNCAIIELTGTRWTAVLLLLLLFYWYRHNCDRDRKHSKNCHIFYSVLTLWDRTIYIYLYINLFISL